MFLGWIGSICIRYTNILPVHGGGKFLFGGTYLMLYYLGMVLAQSKLFKMNLHHRVGMLGISVILSGTWIVLNTYHKLPFDNYLRTYWGDGFNPPSVSFMVYAMGMLFICYSFFSILEEMGICNRIVSVLAIIGRNTLYIFMYHLVIRSVILTYFPQLSNNRLLYLIFVVIPMIGVPVIIMETLKRRRWW